MLGVLVLEGLIVIQTVCSSMTFFCNSIDISSFWERDMITKVRTCLARPWTVSVHLIPRTRNTAADFLAQQAAWEGTSSRVWCQPSSSVLAALCHDVVA